MREQPSGREAAPKHRLGSSIQFEAVIEILRAADRVKRSAMEVISPHRLTLSQFNALRILRGAPEGLSTMEVCERLLERSPGITRIIDGLVKKGLVRRVPHPKDRRSILCDITDAGRELLGSLDGPIEEADRELLEGLAPTEVEHLSSLLSRVRNGVG